MQLESSVILFDDDKVENKFAELQITADGITSEVSRKVGNDEVISRINQSAESVSIDASKINIIGVITAINNNGTTTIDGGKITANSIGANKIKVGEIVIDAAQIGSGTILSARIPSLDAGKITSGILTDLTGDNYWNLTSGQLVTQQGIIGPFTATPEKLYYKINNTQIVLRENVLSIRRRDSFNDDPTTYYMWGTKMTGGDIYFYLADDGDFSTSSNKARMGLIRYRTGGNSYYGIGIFNGVSNDSFLATFRQTGITYPIYFYESTYMAKNLTVAGTKSRQVETENYSNRLLYCYETPTPIFGDIGEATLDENGLCYVDLDDIFAEAIDDQIEYQVFLQKEGQGDCWVANKTSRYFIIQGTPNLKVAWELKAKQKGYGNIRLEQSDYGVDEYVVVPEEVNAIEDYITQQEGILYGNY